MYVCMYVCIYIYIYSNAILAKFRVYVVEKTSLIEVYIGITVIQFSFEIFVLVDECSIGVIVYNFKARHCNVCVYMYVCMYVYIYIYTHTHTHTKPSQIRPEDGSEKAETYS